MSSEDKKQKRTRNDRKNTLEDSLNEEQRRKLRSLFGERKSEV